MHIYLFYPHSFLCHFKVPIVLNQRSNKVHSSFLRLTLVGFPKIHNCFPKSRKSTIHQFHFLGEEMPAFLNALFLLGDAREIKPDTTSANLLAALGITFLTRLTACLLASGEQNLSTGSFLQTSFSGCDILLVSTL